LAAFASLRICRGVGSAPKGCRGGRAALGYPACPRLEDQAPLLKLLKAERIGVELSDEWQLHPEQSTSAIVLHHPRAKYFSV
jgi:5-methyltetrahydrofolate--homocysteine methyltransferase